MAVELTTLSKEFSKLTHEPVRNCKSALPEEYIEFLKLRETLIREEFEEFEDAIRDLVRSLKAKQTPTEAVTVELLDSLVDMIYLAVGTAEILGFDIEGAFHEVHRSNMSKTCPETGKFIISDGTDGYPKGKVIKGPNYSKPDLRKFIKLFLF
jgi:predicted HAD superfamily Cof-like phosphohydrolase